MYEQHWGLNFAPFREPAGPNGFYVGEPQEEALARLDFAFESSYRLSVIAGGVGTGKSLVAEHAARQLRSAGHQARQIGLLGLDAEDFVVSVADSLRVNYQDRGSYASTWRGILDEFHVTKCQNLKTVLFFDDANDAEAEVLTNVCRLAQWKPGEDTQLSIVLISDARRMHLLGERLNELSSLRIDLFAWELQDVAGFLDESLNASGATEQIFSDDAHQQIWDLTDGVARRVRRLAELSMLAAAADGARTIDGEMVALAHGELTQATAASF